jgi:NAD(P)-dependent dehydrogenase (short-subunit alcohol dehydrogenase family)
LREVDVRPDARCESTLQGKAALVTGAAGGIGTAIVSAFRSAGARVLALDVKADALSVALAEMGDDVRTRCCDLTREDDVQAAIAAAVEMFGRIDVLVNGIAADEPRGTIVELSPAIWDQTFAANVRAAFLMSRAVVPVMARSGGGSIIHIASQLGRVATAKRPLYCATKGALIQLARAMAIDHAADGIRVNALSPGAVATSRLSRRYGDLKAASARWPAPISSGDSRSRRRSLRRRFFSRAISPASSPAPISLWMADIPRFNVICGTARREKDAPAAPRDERPSPARLKSRQSPA